MLEKDNKQYLKQYYIKNRERLLKYRKNRYRNNKEYRQRILQRAYKFTTLQKFEISIDKLINK